MASSKLATCIMYAIILMIAVGCMWLDKQDWTCPRLFSPSSECREGIGMPIANTEVQEGDTPCETLKRIRLATKASSSYVKWRKAMYMAIFLCFAIFILVATPGSLPEWTDFYVAAFVAFALLLCHHNWYDYHRIRVAEKNAQPNIDALRKYFQCMH